MRKIWIMALSALAVLVSCTQEEAFEIVETPDDALLVKETVTFTAVLPETKTALGVKDGDTWPNYWSTADMISVNGVSSEALDASFNGLASATFTVDGIAAPYYAAYPASAVSGYSAGSATITFPEDQTYVDGSYDPAAFVMLASSSSATLGFSPQVTIFKVTPTGSKAIKRISITANGSTKIAGEFTTNFSGLTPTGDAVSTVAVSAASPIAAGTPWFIVLPAVDFSADGFKIAIVDEDNGVMTRQTKPSKAWAAGKMYAATIPYTPDALKLSAIDESASSSSLVFEFGMGDVDADKLSSYTAALYSDSGCSNLVVSYTIPGDSSCWEELEALRFVFGGLNPSTTYYCKVTDNTRSSVSGVVSGTTDAFTAVNAIDVDDAAPGEVLLAEDFSEIGWGPDEFAFAAGFVPSPRVLADLSGAKTTDDGTFTAYKNTGNRLFGSGVDLGSSRLSSEWGFFGNSAVYLRNGYLRVATTSGRTHIVTPGLNGIPAGKYATIDVTVTVAKHEDNENDVAVFVNSGLSLNGTDDTNNASYRKYTGVSLSGGHPLGVTSSRVWETKTVRISNVEQGDQLVIGSLEDISKMNRFSISDIVVELVELYSDVKMEASHISSTSSTLVYEWTNGISEDDDIIHPYTISLYSDSDCSALVESFTIEPGDDGGTPVPPACWNGKTPRFVFSGLSPATTYYFKVVNGDDGNESVGVAGTTEEFTVVDATTVSNAAIGDVILAEDFSEIGWGVDETVSAAGFYPSSKTLYVPSGAYTSVDGSFTNSGTARRLYGDTRVTSDKRLYHWGFFGNSAVYAQAAFLRVCTSSSGARTHIVSPALSGIPDGMKATIDVTVTARQYANSTNDIGIFVEDASALSLALDPDDSEDSNFSSKGGKYTGASLSNGYEMNIETTTWETKTVRIKGVTNGNCLVIGSYENIDTKNRFYISDVKVTIVDLKAPGTIDAVMGINDFDTFKAFLTACGTGDTIQGNVTADITLTSEQVADIDALYPVSEFEGILNGNNHTIAGLTKPLFDELTGSVSDLTLNSILNITTAQNNVGILANTATDATISGCTTTGSVTLSYDSQVSGSIALGGMVGVLSGCTLTNCQNQATVENTTGSSVGIFIGGLAGESDSSTFVTCSNTADISNSGLAADFSGYPCDLNMGGLVGYLHGVNILTGTSSDYNYNTGNISETSDCSYVGIGGIAGSSAGEGTDMAYVHNTGIISYTGNTRYNSYIGGIVGCAQEIFTMDYANNAGDLKIRSITVSHQTWMGGILGGFNASNSTTKNASLTVTGCVNSGDIDCPNASSGANMGASSSSVTSFSYMGGICGVGDCGAKEFINCSNSGHIAVYNQIKMRLGGILGYTTVNPTGCVNTGPINYCRYKGPGNSGASVVGGIVGYTGITTPHDLTNDATVRSTGSSPASLCGGIAGQVGGSTTGFENCNVGSSTGSQKTISGAGENSFAKSNAAGLFTSVSDSRAWDFTGCKVKNGTKCQNMEVTSENLNSALIGNNKPPTSVTNPPIFVDSF